jgi:hypothetical protein
MHPTGKHTATVIKAEVAESKTKGTPGVFFTFRTASGEIDGAFWLTEKEFTKRDGTTSSPITETLTTLRKVFGFNDDFETLGTQIEGRECSITIENETDDKGKDWPRVKWINALGGSASKPLLARLTAQAKKIAKPAGMPAPAPVTADDGDVPF